MACSATVKRGDELREPLLLSRPVLGDEETLLAMEESILLRDDDDAEEELESSHHPYSWCDSLVIWLILPGLLWLDFCLAFWTNPESTCNLRFSVVNISFVLFMISACLYRKMMEELETGRVVVVLLPEIAMNVVLALILANKIVAAFLFLLSSILVLSSVVVVYSVCILCATDERHSHHCCDDDDDDAAAAEGKLRGSGVVVPPRRRVRWSRDLEDQDFHAERFL